MVFEIEELKDLIIAGVITLSVLLLLFTAAYGQNNCEQFGFSIPTSCCCTRDCCREAEPWEVEHFYADFYLIVPTGQEIRRSGWSEDGKIIRCACDPGPNGSWIKHLKAKTHCLFVPRPASS